MSESGELPIRTEAKKEQHIQGFLDKLADWLTENTEVANPHALAAYDAYKRNQSIDIFKLSERELWRWLLKNIRLMLKPISLQSSQEALETIRSVVDGYHQVGAYLGLIALADWPEEALAVMGNCPNHFIFETPVPPERLGGLEGKYLTCLVRRDSLDTSRDEAPSYFSQVVQIKEIRGDDVIVAPEKGARRKRIQEIRPGDLTQILEAQLDTVGFYASLGINFQDQKEQGKNWSVNLSHPVLHSEPTTLNRFLTSQSLSQTFYNNIEAIIDNFSP